MARCKGTRPRNTQGGRSNDTVRSFASHILPQIYLMIHNSLAHSKLHFCCCSTRCDIFFQKSDERATTTTTQSQEVHDQPLSTIFNKFSFSMSSVLVFNSSTSQLSHSILPRTELDSALAGHTEKPARTSTVLRI
jgi:hypothetical protein